MVIEKVVAVEADELAKETPIGIIGGRLDSEGGGTEELGEVMDAQGQLTDYAVGATAAALERPEQIGVGACIGDADLAVGGDYFGFEQSCGGEAVMFREAAKAATLNEAGDADGQASATLDIFSGFGRYDVV